MPRFDWDYPDTVVIREAGSLAKLREVIWIDTDKCELEQYVTKPSEFYYHMNFGPDGKFQSCLRKFKRCSIARTIDGLTITLEGLDDGIHIPGT